jgi:cytoskeletal protein RodZ
MNSTLVLFTDHPAPTSEFSAEEEEKEEEVNSNSTSRGDLDSDPATGLLSPVLIRQQQQKKKKDTTVNKKKKSTVKSPSIQEAAAAAGKGQSLLPVDQTGFPTKEGNNSRGKKKTQRQQSVPVDLGQIELRKTQTAKRS